MMCNWCKGHGFLRINGRKIVCLNCRGAGVGGDGGLYRTIGGRSKRMIGNQRGIKKGRNFSLPLRRPR